MVPSSLRRLAAYFIDQMIGLVFMMPLIAQLWASVIVNSKTQVVSISLKWLVLGLVFRFLYTLFFLKLAGGTLGKLIMGLRLVPRDPNIPELTWAQVLVRVLSDLLTFFFGYGHYCLMLIRFDRTHLSDWLAETRVIQIHGGKKAKMRRPVLALVLGLYFAISGFMSTARFLQRSHLQGDQLVILNLWSSPKGK